jgi:hypothetical protein
MKPHTIIIAAVAACGFTQALPAQDTNAPTPAGKCEKPKGWRGMEEKLPEEMRERFREARDAAMSDPEIQALKQKADEAAKEFREAMRAAIASKDPELAQKVKEGMKEWKGSHGGKGGFLKNLPEADKEKLKAARQIAQQAPGVQSAKDALKSATTPEQRQAAAENLRKAMREAMLAADPSLADIIDKLPPGPPPHAPDHD